MEQPQDLKALQEQIQAALISTTRTAGQISSEDLAFQRSLNPEVGIALDEQSERLLSLASALLKSAASISELRAPSLGDADDLENNWRSVVDVVDSLLEKSDVSLDEYTGVIKRKDPTIGEQSGQVTTKTKKPFTGNAFRSTNMLKPQLTFDTKPNNADNTPWKPLLLTKPHARVPFKESLETTTDDSGQQQYDYTIFLPLLPLPPSSARPGGLSKSQILRHKRYIQALRTAGSTKAVSALNSTDSHFRYKHPYEQEIQMLEYPEAVYQKADPMPYQPVETTSATFVDTEAGVLEMLKDLKVAKEIAIDLEHHDQRSYVGLVSLMQISTREKDWIVDTLKPWRQNLQVLNEVFTDPNIVKVFHGAYMDIIWLQRDLGLYIVGLFDTHWASRTLGYAGGSLAFLLKKFIDFDADKQYQLADWRIRPLPAEMFFYARADTHFLLYIYDNMRNELIDRTKTEIPEENLLEQVLQKSKETSLLRYERVPYNAESGRGPGGWYSLIVKNPSLFNNEQFAVFRAVHEWRDQTARTDDESPTFVMTQHVLISIAKLMPLDMVALLNVAHPASHSLKSRAGELLALIKSAKAKGKKGPSMMDVLRPDSVGVIAKANLPATNDAKVSAQPLIAVFDEGELRSQNSTFWGGAFGSSLWDAPSAIKESDELRLAVPLPALSSEIFAAPSGFVDPPVMGESPQTPLPVRTMEESPEKIVEQAFVVRRGGKRRSEAMGEAEEEGPEKRIRRKNESLEDAQSIQGAKAAQMDRSHGKETSEEAEKAKVVKKQRNKNRKAARKAAKKAQGETIATGDEPDAEADNSMDVDVEDEVEEEEEVFDYSKAEPVMHGKRTGNDKGGKKGKKPFNPYAKSADAPKGMRRLQTERAGKTHTFKN